MFLDLLLAMSLAISHAPSADAVPLSPVEGLRSDRFASSVDAGSLKIEVASDTPVPLYLYNGWRMALANPGQEYRLKITNTHKDERILVRVSIDGLNPKDGRRSYLAQPGYVIGPGKTIEISQITQRRGSPLPLSIPRVMTIDKPGHIAVASFRENLAYPHLLPWSVYANEDPEKVGSIKKAGTTTLWLPPPSARFRQLSSRAENTVSLFYSHKDLVVADVLDETSF